MQIFVSYCWRCGPNTDREVILRRVTVDRELAKVTAQIKTAVEEKNQIADLYDLLADDPSQVANVIASYFNTMKKKEAAYLESQANAAKTRANGGSPSRTMQSSSPPKRRLSKHFASDETMVPTQFADGPLDMKSLTLLSSSVWAPNGDMMLSTKPKTAKKALHSGKVLNTSHNSSMLQGGGGGERTESPGRTAFKHPSPIRGRPVGYMLPTAVELSHLNAPKSADNWNSNLRGSGKVKLELAEKIRLGERLKSSSTIDRNDPKIKKLEELLRREQLKTEALDTMIDIAEDSLKVAIRKKSGSKQ